MRTLSLRHEISPRIPSDAVSCALAALRQCQQACESAGDDTVGSYGLLECIELLHGCAGRCAHTETMLATLPEIDVSLLRHQLSECAELCDHCAKRCLRHADFSNWEFCVESARECADTCRYLLLAMPTGFAVAS